MASNSLVHMRAYVRIVDIWLGTDKANKARHNEETNMMPLVTAGMTTEIAKGTNASKRRRAIS